MARYVVSGPTPIDVGGSRHGSSSAVDEGEDVVVYTELPVIAAADRSGSIEGDDDHRRYAVSRILPLLSLPGHLSHPACSAYD